MAVEINPPFRVFTDVDGEPLEDGYIHIGAVNQNPQAVPISVFWDVALTIPAAQPIRTLGGYPSRSGTPSRMYVAEAEYSISVSNKNSTLIYSSLDSDDPLAEASSPSNGAALIARGDQVVDSIAELRALLKTSASKYAFINGYYVAGDGGGGQYYLDAADTTSADNGVTIIVGADGGRWKLVHNGVITFKQAGGKEDGVADDLAAWNQFLAVLPGNKGTFSGVSLVSGTVNLPASNITLAGASSLASIKAMDSTNFEYTLRAQSLSNIILEGFTADSNRLGRVAVLTTRTVSISLESCTDSSVTKCRGINAIGSASIPGIGISTAGTGLRVNTTNCTAVDCGIVGKAADGFFCSSSHSINTGNVAINCLDTGHVLESCSYSGIVGCVSIDCGVVGAITNAIATDTYGNFISGLRGQDWNSSVTGGVQISALAAGNLIETSVSGLSLIGVVNFIGPGISVRRTSTGRVDGLTLECSIRNGSAQGVLIDSAHNVSVDARVAGTVNACVQVMGDSDNIVVSGKTNLNGGTFGVISQNTSSVLVNGAHIKSPSSYGVFAFDTSVMTSTMNDIVGPGIAYEGNDVGATLNRMTLVNGLFSLESVVASAPLTATLTSKFTAADKTGGVAGVVGLSVS